MRAMLAKHFLLLEFVLYLVTERNSLTQLYNCQKPYMSS